MVKIPNTRRHYHGTPTYQSTIHPHLRIGALAWVTDPTGVGIFDTPQGKSIARLSRGYVVEIIGGPEVKP